MTARQGKVLVCVTVLLLTGLLARAAVDTGEWTGFFVTEVGLLLPMAVSWMILSEPRIPEGRP